MGRGDADEQLQAVATSRSGRYLGRFRVSSSAPEARASDPLRARFPSRCPALSKYAGSRSVIKFSHVIPHQNIRAKMSAAVETYTVQSAADRRQQDGAALSALEAFELDMPVPDIIKRFSEAGLLHTMPLNVDSHSRQQLERMVASQGVVAARRIEAAMKRGPSASLTTPLSADPEFQKYMALRLQLTEGVQVRSSTTALLM